MQNMTLTRRIITTIALTSTVLLAACRFDPNAVRKVAEQGKSTVEAVVATAPAGAEARATETPSVVLGDPSGAVSNTAPISGVAAITDNTTGISITEVLSEAIVDDTEMITDVIEPEVITASIEASESITVDANSLISDTEALTAEAVMTGTEIISSGVAVAEPALVTETEKVDQVARVTVTVTVTDAGKSTTQTGSVVIAEPVTTTKTFAPAVSTTPKDGASGTTVVMTGTADAALIVNPDDVVTTTATSPAAQTPRVVTQGSDTAETPAEPAASGTPRTVTRTRRSASVVCVVPSRRAVNLRRAPSTASGRIALLGPRTRFVATARSSSGRWVYVSSAKGRGWVAASVVGCSAAPQRLTVRSR
jgi:hypothetical protein